MIGDHLLPHQIHPVVSAETTDEYGNPVRRPETQHGPVPAYVQPMETNEDVSEGQVRETRARAFVRPDVPALDAWSHVVWEQRDYEVIGDPRRHDSPTGPHHQIIYLRRTGA